RRDRLPNRLRAPEGFVRPAGGTFPGRNPLGAPESERPECSSSAARSGERVRDAPDLGAAALGCRVMADATRAALTAIPLFAGLDDETLVGLAERTMPFEAPAGHVLVEVGQPGSGLFVIEAGEVEVEVAGRIVVLGAGEFFG